MIANPIRTENLSKKFNRVEAVKALNLDIPEGAIYTLLGPNGAGKTTTIKILMNIFEATGGRAEVLGIDSRQIRGRAFEQIGYMSENQEMPGWMRVDAFFAYLRPVLPNVGRRSRKRTSKRFRPASGPQNQAPVARYEDEGRARQRLGLSPQAHRPR